MTSSTRSPRSRRRNRQLGQLVLAAAAAAGSTAISSIAFAQTNGTWGVDVGTAGGSWSNPANWVGGSIADNGGIATFNTLPFSTAPLAIIQDLPNVTVSRLQFNSFITNNITRPNATTNTLTLSGQATIDVATPTINALATTFFGQNITIPIAGSAGLTKTGPGTSTLLGINTYTGGTNVNGGVLCARVIGGNSDQALGAAGSNVSINDGTLRINTGTLLSGRTFTITGSGTIEGGSVAMTFNGDVTGTGAFNKAGTNVATFAASNTLSGSMAVQAGSVVFSGNGAMGSVSSIFNRGTISLDNVTTNNTNRINNAAPITMLGSNLQLLGNASGASSETLGDVTFSRGTGLISVVAGAGQSAALNLGNASRDTGGTVFFRGDNLGATLGAGATNITFASAPTLVGGGGTAGSTNISVIPWAWGAAANASTFGSNTNGLVTYGATGVRPLDNTTEYVTTIAPGISTNNVRLTVPLTLNSGATINALVIAGGTGVTGPSTLSITSGALLNLQNASIVSCAVDFGSAEGMILGPASISFSGVISGSNGLTKQGAGVATFSGIASNYTGTTTIGAGTAVFTSNVTNTGAASVFGSSTNAIQLSPAGVGTGGTTARLVYAGAGTGVFSRDLNVSARIATNNAATIPGFGANGAAALDMSGNINLDSTPMAFVGGAGSVVTVNGNITGNGLITDQASTATSTIALKGNNTFTGGAELSAAVWQVGSNSAFGTGLIRMVQLSASPTIAAIGGPRTVGNDIAYLGLSSTYWTIGGSNDITFTGNINLGGALTHTINNTGLTTYAGPVHTGGFTKAGTGTLVLSGDNFYTGTTNVNAGVLRAAHANALGTPQYGTNVASGATMEITNNALSAEPVTINGTGIAAAGGAGAIRSTSGTNSLGAITLATSSAIGVDSGSSLSTGNVGVSVATNDLTKVGGGNLTANRYRVNNLNVNAGTAAVVLGRDANNKVSQTALLTIPGGATPTATLDLGDNDLIASATPKATIESLVAYARDNGAWDRGGVSSTAARLLGYHPKTLGVLGGSEYIGANSSTFDGVTVNPTDTLVMYTWNGDTNFDGTITPGDYARIDAAFAAPQPPGAGWFNGDFNFDQSIDHIDYAMIDVANTYIDGRIQRAIDWLTFWDHSENGMNFPSLQLVEQHFNQFGQPYVDAFLSTIAPEPATMGLLMAAVPILARRRRRN